MKIIINFYFIFCVVLNLYVYVFCKKKYLILYVNKKCNIMNFYLVLGVCFIRVWAGDFWGSLGVVFLLVVVDFLLFEIIENECYCIENCLKN